MLAAASGLEFCALNTHTLIQKKGGHQSHSCPIYQDDPPPEVLPTGGRHELTTGYPPPLCELIYDVKTELMTRGRPPREGAMCGKGQ